MARKRDYRQIDRFALWAKYEGLCGICEMPVDSEAFTIDHIIPLCRGGRNKEKNFQPAHYECNQFKGDSMPWEEPKRKKHKKLAYRNWGCYNKRHG